VRCAPITLETSTTLATTAPIPPPSHTRPLTPPSVPQNQSQNGPILTDLIDDVDAEYLNHVDKCGNQQSDNESYTSSRKYAHSVSSPCGGSIQDDYVTSPSRAEVKLESKPALENQDNNKPYDNNTDEKDYIQNCQELNKYSDLIKFPEMTSSVSSPTTTATSPSAQSPYQQRIGMNQSQDSYDEDSAGKS